MYCNSFQSIKKHNIHIEKTFILFDLHQFIVIFIAQTEKISIKILETMIKREKSIELLNKAVADEMTAVNQYMYFHFRLDDMGYDLLSSFFKKTAITEMMHVELLAERILFLKGEVEMKCSEPVAKIHDVKAMLEQAVAMESKSVEDYNKWANECANAMDSATKKVFENLVGQEEGHLDRFETEIENLDKFGDNYLALQSIERSKTVSSGTVSED